MIHWIYLITLLFYIILVVGFYLKNPIILLFSVMLGFALSVYILAYGMDNFDNFVTLTFGAVTFGLSAYVGIRSGLELFED